MPPSIDEQDDLEVFRKTNVGQPLLAVAKDFQKRALARFLESGHTELQPSHQAVITHLRPSGTRLTDLANYASMTKQAMGQLVDEVERLGYVERRPDPKDGRAKIVQFTQEGHDLIRDGRRIVREIQEEWADLIGEKKVRALRDILYELLTATRDERGDDTSS